MFSLCSLLANYVIIDPASNNMIGRNKYEAKENETPVHTDLLDIYSAISLKNLNLKSDL